MNMTIKEALESLDHTDDSHWIKSGLPRMGVIEELVGDKSITRQDVTAADPEFCRQTEPMTDDKPCGHIFQGQCQLHKEVVQPCNCSQRS